MTIDKIRANMQANLFEHWANCRDIEILNSAKKTLKSEIVNGLLKGIQYEAELQLLQLLTEQE